MGLLTTINTGNKAVIGKTGAVIGKTGFVRSRAFPQEPSTQERVLMSKMDQTTIAVGSQSVEVQGPASTVATLRKIYREPASPNQQTRHSLSVERMETDEAELYEIYDSLGTLSSGIRETDVLALVVEAHARMAAFDEKERLALKADLLFKDSKPLLIADTGGPGRAIATIGLAERSFAYAGSDLVLIGPDAHDPVADQGAVVLDRWASGNLSRLASLNDVELHGAEGRRVALLPVQKNENMRTFPLLLFPHFEEGAEFSASAVSPEECIARLSQCLLNAANFDGGGLDQLTAIAENCFGLSVRFGAPNQMERMGAITSAILESGLAADKLVHLTNALSSMGGQQQSTIAVAPKATPHRGKKRLTIGMATFDDYDGVYFTLQSLRLHHPDIIDETELVVVDNNPTGACAEPLKRLDTVIPNYRYIPFGDNKGTAASRAKIFEEATGDFVLVIDCHVLLAPGSLMRLDRYFHDNPQTVDLLQGPMVRDNLKSVFTHWEQVWRRGMYGEWAEDPRGADPDTEPFDIPMQGCALFACRREVWPGFNPAFRGFGGEEGYLHEKFRQKGGRTLCLPFLRWLHRFQRPMGVPYPLVWEDRIRNYLIGWMELGLATDPIVEHFSEIIGETSTKKVLEAVTEEMASSKT